MPKVAETPVVNVYEEELGHRLSKMAIRYQTICILGAQTEYLSRLRQVSVIGLQATKSTMSPGEYGWYWAEAEDEKFRAEHGIDDSLSRKLAIICAAAERAHERMDQIGEPDEQLLVPRIYRAELPAAFAEAEFVEDGLLLGGFLELPDLPTL